MTVQIIEGDLLEYDVQYIVHQTNCITSDCKGLALSLFNKYPWANVYSERAIGKYHHIPGNIYIRKDPDNISPHVINAMGQFTPGGIGKLFINGVEHEETAKMRAGYFLSCLQKIMKIKGLKSIAFPWRIGCGIADGDWDYYQRLIEIFSNKMPDVEVFIVKRITDN